MFEHLIRVYMNIYLRQVASEGINHHVEHCIFVPASRVLFSSRCPTFRVSLLSSCSCTTDINGSFCKYNIAFLNNTCKIYLKKLGN